MKRTPPPSEPWCIIAYAHMGLMRTLRVPESAVQAQDLTRRGWTVVIRDSEMPTQPPSQPFYPRDYQPYMGGAPSQSSVQRAADNTDKEQD